MARPAFFCHSRTRRKRSVLSTDASSHRVWPTCGNTASIFKVNFHMFNLVALLLSRGVSASRPGAMTSRYISLAFLQMPGKPSIQWRLPRSTCSHSNASRRSRRWSPMVSPSIHGTRLTAGEGGETPSPTPKRSRGRPRAISTDEASVGKDDHGDDESGPARDSRRGRSVHRGRGREQGKSSDLGDDGDGVGQTSAPARTRAPRQRDRARSFAGTSAGGGDYHGTSSAGSELQDLELLASTLDDQDRQEDSRMIRRELERLRGEGEAADALAGTEGRPSEADMNELVRQQLIQQYGEEEEVVAAERRRLQDLEKKAIEEEMQRRHKVRQRKQQERILAEQKDHNEVEDAAAASQAFGDDEGRYLVGGDDDAERNAASEDAGSDQDDMHDDFYDLPSALEIIQTVEFLLGEVDGQSQQTSEVDDEVPVDDAQELILTEVQQGNLLHNRGLRQVMVVIGKHLMRDQVTVEYASRIRHLVEGLKSGRLRPDLVCFTGGRVRGNNIADASAGYVFFRHLCAQEGVNTFNIGFLVEGESTCTKEAMKNVVREVSRMEREEMQDMEEEMMPRPKYHFTLISNEYHLSRVIMVHEISESVSLLSPLKQLDASWGYEQVPYPFETCDDENLQFQADVYKTLEELVPLQVNVQAVARREVGYRNVVVVPKVVEPTPEFFQEENYASLGHVRAKVTDFLREVQSSRGPLARHMNLMDLQRAAEQGRRGKMGTLPAGQVEHLRLDEALEWAAGALAKIQEIIEPAATRRNSVSLRAWAMCAALLEKAILQGQMAADPDRPLYHHEWAIAKQDEPEREPLEDEDTVEARARETVFELLEREGYRMGRGRNLEGKKVLHFEGVDAAAALEEDLDEVQELINDASWMDRLPDWVPDPRDYGVKRKYGPGGRKGKPRKGKATNPRNSSSQRRGQAPGARAAGKESGVEGTRDEKLAPPVLTDEELIDEMVRQKAEEDREARQKERLSRYNWAVPRPRARHESRSSPPPPPAADGGTSSEVGAGPDTVTATNDFDLPRGARSEGGVNGDPLESSTGSDEVGVTRGRGASDAFASRRSGRSRKAPREWDR